MKNYGKGKQKNENLHMFGVHIITLHYNHVKIFKGYQVNLKYKNVIFIKNIF